MFKTGAKILLSALIAMFIIGKSFALFHGFSHYDFSHESSFNSGHASLVENSDKHHKSSKDFHNCALCVLINFQNHFLIAANIPLFFTGFLLVFANRFFGKIKLSFLLNSFSSRAPPAIS